MTNPSQRLAVLSLTPSVTFHLMRSNCSVGRFQITRQDVRHLGTIDSSDLYDDTYCTLVLVLFVPLFGRKHLVQCNQRQSWKPTANVWFWCCPETPMSVTPSQRVMHSWAWRLSQRSRSWSHTWQWMLISGCLSAGIWQIRYTWNKQVYSRNKSSQMISHATPYIYLYISILNKRIFPYMLVSFMVRLSLVIFQYYWNKASDMRTL